MVPVEKSTQIINLNPNYKFIEGIQLTKNIIQFPGVFRKVALLCAVTLKITHTR